MSREATGSDTLANECDDCGLSSGVVRLWCIIEKEGKKEEEGDGFSLQKEELSTKRAEVTTVRVLPEAELRTTLLAIAHRELLDKVGNRDEVNKVEEEMHKAEAATAFTIHILISLPLCIATAKGSSYRHIISLNQ